MRLIKRLCIGVAGTLALAIAALALVLSHTTDCPAPVVATPAGQLTMRAIQQRCYGPPSVLALEEVVKPVPAAHEILVRVQTAALNPLDWHMTTGWPYILRMANGLGAPDDPRTGVDFAGTVEAVGPQVTRFKPGDEVFGARSGAFAEYLVMPEDRAVTRKPAELGFEQAAALPIAAVTALQGLRDHGRIKAGQKVLINGASGGVGTFAVQIARSYGAQVTAVCSTRNAELVRSLGADQVIDYTQEDFTRGQQRYDLILDNVGNHSPEALRNALAPEGIVVIVGAPKRDPWIGMFWGVIQAQYLSWLGDQRFVSFTAVITRDDLDVLAELARSGAMTPVIDRRFPLNEVPAAMAYLGGWHARGKVVVQIGASGPTVADSVLAEHL